jgi:hypothetical protein
MIKLFKQHPASVNESYLEHMFVALSFFVYFSYAAFAALVHAFLPFLFIKTGSKVITDLNQRMVVSRQTNH